MKKRANIRVIFVLAMFMLICAGCQDPTPVCPPITGTPVFLDTTSGLLATPTPGLNLYIVEIGGKEVTVDKIVEGPLCNDTWSGTVYVACDVQVYPWQDQPTFLKDCQLNIDPQSVVYVAHHNDTAYYNGCSCHVELTPQP